MTRKQLVESAITKIVKNVLTENSVRQIIQDLEKLKAERDALDPDDLKTQNKLDRQAFDIAGQIYDVMGGDKYFEKDDIANIHKGKIAMIRLIQRHYSPELYKSDIDQWYKLRRNKLKQK